MMGVIYYEVADAIVARVCSHGQACSAMDGERNSDGMGIQKVGSSDHDLGLIEKAFSE